MSKNIEQVYVANPITSNASTDLMYFGQSPYGTGNDAAMTYANFSAQFGAPYTPAALTSANDTNVTITLGGTPSTALLHAASITMGWSGQLSLARGGSNASLTASNGGIIYSTASAMAVLAGTATANLPLLSGSTSAPTWGAFALSLGGALTTAGALTTSGAFGVTFTFTNTTNVTFPTSGTLATTSGSVVTINGDSGSAAPSAGVLTISGGTTGLTTSASSSTVNITGTLNLTHGGTNASLTASNGGIVWSNATQMQILSGTATASQVLLSGASATPAWSTATYPATTTVNQLLYSSSANVIAGLATANSAMIFTTSAGVPGWTGAATNGQLLIGSTGASPVLAALTAGTNISITNGAASITINATGAASFAWTDVSGTSQAMVANNGYIADNAALVTLTLPTTAAQGTLISICGNGAGGWTIAQNASQNIKIGSQTTTTGVGGSLSSSNRYDQVEFLCTVANTTWAVRNMVGNLTYV
jgi:hypothetical protein